MKKFDDSAVLDNFEMKLISGGGGPGEDADPRHQGCIQGWSDCSGGYSGNDEAYTTSYNGSMSMVNIGRFSDNYREFNLKGGR